MRFKTIEKVLANPWLVLILIAVTVLVVYSNAYTGPFVFDGKLQIEDQMKIRDLNKYSSLKGFFPHRPLTAFSFALNYRMGELEPFGYHLVNILLHMFNGMLVYLLALCVFGRLSLFPVQRSIDVKNKAQIIDRPAKEPWDPFTYEHMMALLAVLIFDVHPIQTQPVTDILQRYTSMSALFYLASVLFYVQARKLQIAQMTQTQVKLDKPGANFFRVFVCFFLFVFLGILAILCKENAATLFGVILLVEYFLFDRTWHRAVRINRRHVMAQNNLGIALAKQLKLEEVKKHLLTAVLLDPNSAEIENNLGQVFMLQDNIEEAAGHFEAAIRLNPHFSQALTNLGFMRLRQRKQDETVAYFLKALETDSGNIRARQGLRETMAIKGGLGP